MDPDEVLREAVWREVRYQHSIIEEACERALTGGEHGVLVIRMGTVLVSASVDPAVPYGTIHETQLGPPGISYGDY